MHPKIWSPGETGKLIVAVSGAVILIKSIKYWVGSSLPLYSLASTTNASLSAAIVQTWLSSSHPIPLG